MQEKVKVWVSAAHYEATSSSLRYRLQLHSIGIHTYVCKCWIRLIAAVAHIAIMKNPHAVGQKYVTHLDTFLYEYGKCNIEFNLYVEGWQGKF